MSQKIKMDQNKFRIGELADKLKIKKFVIRFWEKEFDLKSDRSGGGQRFYSQKDLETFSQIKELLYKKKFTIPGAKTELKNRKNINPATMEKTPEAKSEIIFKEVIKKVEIEVVPQDFLYKLSTIKKQLNELMLKL